MGRCECVAPISEPWLRHRFGINSRGPCKRIGFERFAADSEKKPRIHTVTTVTRTVILRNPDQLWMALEPEAASVYIRKQHLRQPIPECGLASSGGRQYWSRGRFRSLAASREQIPSKRKINTNFQILLPNALNKQYDMQWAI